ncbi:MAG: dienelactone hydrolase family protein [Hyphomicrobiaceae bacterium]|nr:dienelactone hydrolase family protein [Hyphomicrobiaceae bacterium]
MSGKKLKKLYCALAETYLRHLVVSLLLLVPGLFYAFVATAEKAISKPLETRSVADTIVGHPLEAPVNRRPVSEKFWWSDDWYLRGKLIVPTNHEVIERATSYINPADGTEIPAIIYRPKGKGKYPAILFQHGRRGLDEMVQRLPRRLAARGFVVLAPNVYDARFIEKFPMEHKPETEGDTAAGIEFLLKQPDISTSKICLYSHTRGGYYTLKAAVDFKHQHKHVSCYASSYPHWQNPNAVEPAQVYRYAPEADRLTIPAMIFIGEYEQYQRRRSIETAVKFMKQAGRDIKLVIYPGVGRGFDFRPPSIRTFADDLATKDQIIRLDRFFRQHLSQWQKK